jgi:4-hydroxy-tetrahydrodipicolinate synthase
MKFSVNGIIVAMVTPFIKGGAHVDYDKIAPFAERLVKQGAGGLFPCGTTGEGLLMHPEERKEVLEEVIMAVGGKTTIIAHTGTMETASTIELTAHAAEAGAHAAAIVAPMYYKYDERALKKYYLDIAHAVKGFPILLYNIPACARNELTPECILDLAHGADNIVGIKDSSGEMVKLTRVLAEAPKGFNVINGVDEYGYQAFLAGTTAAVSGTSNAVLDVYRRVYDNVKKGKLKEAWAAQRQLTAVCAALSYGSAVAIKHAVRLRGFEPGAVRPPMRELDAKERSAIAAALKKAGIR